MNSLMPWACIPNTNLDLGRVQQTPDPNPNPNRFCEIIISSAVQHTLLELVAD